VVELTEAPAPKAGGPDTVVVVEPAAVIVAVVVVTTVLAAAVVVDTVDAVVVELALVAELAVEVSAVYGTPARLPAWEDVEEATSPQPARNEVPAATKRRLAKATVNLFKRATK